MLVLSRKAGESINIDGRIKVKIVKIKGNQVRIGIEAPDDVAIVRSELGDWHECSFENRSPAGSNVMPQMAHSYSI